MTHTDKNLLLIGSQFPQNIQNDLIDSASELGMKVISADIGAFKSGERFCELYPNQKELFTENKEEILGANVHVVMNMQNDPTVLFFDTINTVETLKRYGAASVHLVLGFSPFARQDREFENRMVSVMGDTFPKHLKCAGVDRISTIDMHSKASEQFFINHFGNENVTFLSAVNEIYEAVCTMTNNESNTKYGAPDGADKPQDVAQRKARQITRIAYTSELEPHMFGIVKGHTGVNSTEVKEFIGDVDGCDVVMIDDMTDTGGTLVNGAFTLKENGAKKVIAAITHGIFSENSLDILTAENIGDKVNPIDVLIVSDSILDIYEKVAHLPEDQRAKVKIVPTVPLMKQTLKFAA